MIFLKWMKIILRGLVTNEGDVMRGFGADITYKQLTLFDDFQLR